MNREKSKFQRVVKSLADLSYYTNDMPPDFTDDQREVVFGVFEQAGLGQNHARTAMLVMWVCHAFNNNDIDERGFAEQLSYIWHAAQLKECGADAHHISATIAELAHRLHVGKVRAAELWGLIIRAADAYQGRTMWQAADDMVQAYAQMKGGRRSASGAVMAVRFRYTFDQWPSWFP